MMHSWYYLFQTSRVIMSFRRHGIVVNFVAARSLQEPQNATNFYRSLAGRNPALQLNELFRLVGAGRFERPTCGPQESRRALSDLLFQPIIVMQSTEDRLGSDAVTEGKLMPMATCRNIRLDGFRCTRT